VRGVDIEKRDEIHRLRRDQKRTRGWEYKLFKYLYSSPEEVTKELEESEEIWAKIKEGSWGLDQQPTQDEGVFKIHIGDMPHTVPIVATKVKREVYVTVLVFSRLHCGN